MKNLTKKLSKLITSISSKDITEAAIIKARQLLLDGISVAVAGTIQETPPSILAEHIRDQGAKPLSSVIGFGFKTTPVNAAYINGSSMHVLDYEPMWAPANHALSTNLPTVLALVETTDVNGLDALTALIKGIELQGWIREASRQYDPGKLKMHPPGLTAPLSSAVAASHILGLDAEGLQHAIGLAVSRTGTSLANVGTMAKMTHCGLSGAMGLDAAQMAQRGFTSNPEALEAPRGYIDMFFKDEFHGSELLNFGPPFRIVEPGYALKMFPSQYATHFVISAGLELHPKIDDSDKIDKVKLTSPEMGYIDRSHPESGLAGKFSFQYTCCAALLDGEVVIDTFEDARRFAPDMEAMLEKVKVIQDPNRPARFEEEVVDLEVLLEDGTTVVSRCDGPRGSWHGKPLEPGDHEAKVRMCLGCRLNDRDTDRVIELASNLECLENKDLCEIMSITSKTKS